MNSFGCMICSSESKIVKFLNIHESFSIPKTFHFAIQNSGLGKNLKVHKVSSAPSLHVKLSASLHQG